MTRSRDESSTDEACCRGLSVTRWLALATSAVLAVVGLRLLDRSRRAPKASAPSPSPQPAAPKPAAPKPRSERKTNGSVPPELADPPPSAAKPAAAETEPADLDLEGVLARLDEHSQRATYGAVAAVVGRLPVNVMSGRDKVPRHSWVVNRKTGKPTNYPADQVHPELTARDHVIDDADELRAWLAEHG